MQRLLENFIHEIRNIHLRTSLKEFIVYHKLVKTTNRIIYPIEKILEEIVVLFSDEKNMRKSARIFKFLADFLAIYKNGIVVLIDSIYHL